MEAAQQVADVRLGDRNSPVVELIEVCRRPIIVCGSVTDVGVGGRTTLRGKYDG